MPDVTSPVPDLRTVPLGQLPPAAAVLARLLGQRAPGAGGRVPVEHLI
jgi:hypothetical protein